MTTMMLTAAILATTVPLALPLYPVTVRPLNRTWVLRCSRCKAHRRLDAGTLAGVSNIGGFVGPAVMCCGSEMGAKILKGTTTDHRCGAKCTGSKGHVCECSCGGKNHGKDA